VEILLHSCCAPCVAGCIGELRRNDIVPRLIWYNPNIHPYQEYKKRKAAFSAFCDKEGLNSEIAEEYGLRDFISDVFPDFDNPKIRCMYCYKKRLNHTAKTAKALGIKFFSTTLLISPYQNHDLIKQIGEEIASENDTEFYYKDFRPYFREGQNYARNCGIYMQNYCGCVFSEEERFLSLPIAACRK